MATTPGDDPPPPDSRIGWAGAERRGLQGLGCNLPSLGCIAVATILILLLFAGWTGDYFPSLP